MSAAKPKLAKLVIKKGKDPEQQDAKELMRPAKKTARKRAAKKTAAKTVVPEPQTAKRVTPVHRFVESLRDKDGIHYRTTAEVADEVGVSVGWIHKIQRSPALAVPSKVARLGQVKVYIYTPEDVEAIRRYLAAQQQVFSNVPASPEGRVESWEEVSKRRGRSTQAEDRENATG